VLAKQFAWSFRYPGPDGQFGPTSAARMDDASGNPFGLDPNDPAGKDDIVSGTLRIPAGRPVRLILNSPDVIHSFFVRELRLKQDVVPGMRIPLSFTVDIPGTYEIPCAELCGLGHHQMRTTMIVMPSGDYGRWKQEQRH
jgi:cytochrome c oxidase subunit 2